MRFLNPEQVAALLDAARGDRLEALWAVAIHTGCREGELLGLRWADVDWHASTVFVQRTLTGTKGGVPAFAEPKTARGRRVIPLPEEAVTALRAHRARQHAERLALGPDYADYGLVFPTHLGTPLRARNVVKTFKVLLARAGLPTEVRVHDLRHTAAALLLGEGTDVASAAAILGHTQPSTTLNVYGHAILEPADGHRSGRADDPAGAGAQTAATRRRQHGRCRGQGMTRVGERERRARNRGRAQRGMGAIPKLATARGVAGISPPSPSPGAPRRAPPAGRSLTPERGDGRRRALRGPRGRPEHPRVAWPGGPKNPRRGGAREGGVRRLVAESGTGGARLPPATGARPGDRCAAVPQQGQLAAAGGPGGAARRVPGRAGRSVLRSWECPVPTGLPRARPDRTVTRPNRTELPAPADGPPGTAPARRTVHRTRRRAPAARARTDTAGGESRHTSARYLHLPPSVPTPTSHR
jgi:hypothetical protein